MASARRWHRASFGVTLTEFANRRTSCGPLLASHIDDLWQLAASDPHGFVSGVIDDRDGKVIHNQPLTEYDRDIPGMHEFALGQLTGPPICLNRPQADAIFGQLYKTASHRNWELRAVEIMAKHMHLVVGVLGDPSPGKVLGDSKSYATRVLNEKWGKPESETWWTEKGSKRKLEDAAAVLAAVEYVRHQANPLLIWIAGEDPPRGDARR